MTKSCTNCKETKPLTQFHNRMQRGKKLTRGECKVCANNRSKDWLKAKTETKQDKKNFYSSCNCDRGVLPGSIMFYNTFCETELNPRYKNICNHCGHKVTWQREINVFR